MSNDITQTEPSPPEPPPARNPWRTFSITLIVLLVLGGISYWVVSVYLFPSAFTPVTLNQQNRLDSGDAGLEQRGGTRAVGQHSLELR